MKILIIEDDDYKADSIADFIKKILANASFEYAVSLADGIKKVTSNVYSLIIIDMAIPSHPTKPGEGAPMSLLTGGLDILFELKTLQRHDPCVIITQYHEIEIAGRLYSIKESKNALKELLECDVLACIEYVEGSSKWGAELKGLLSNHENISF